MPKLQMTEALRQAAIEYNKLSAQLQKVGAELKVEDRAREVKPFVDGRDFFPILMYMGIEGDTPEAREADMTKKLEEITQAFLDPDISKRKPYLDVMYDLRDNFRPDEADLNDPDQARQMIHYLAFGQSYNSQKLGNPAYMAQRYPDKVQRFLGEAAGGQALSTGYILLDALTKGGAMLKPGPTLPYFTAGNDQQTAVYYDYMVNKMQKAREAQATGELPGELVLTCPEVLMPFVGKSVESGVRMEGDPAESLQGYYYYCIDSGLMAPDLMGTEALKEAGMEPVNALFIDGVPMQEFAKRTGPNEKRLGLWQYTVASLALLGQKHRMEMVYTSLDENGQLQMEPKPVRVKFTPEQERRYLVENHSWFRRTFFNWGPFRIKSLQEQADALWVDPDADQRHEQMCDKLKETFDTKRKALQDKAAAEKIKEQRKKEERRLFKEAEKELQEVREAAKGDGVLSVLGDQMKTYRDIQNDMMGYNNRLELFATSMAKHVLFWQVKQERQLQSDGTIGPMETKLLGDGKEETIRANIDAAVSGMKTDPVFVDMLYAKAYGKNTGNERDLNYETFGKAMSNGGSERFSREYMLRLKDTQPEKAEPDDNVLNKSMHEMQNKQEGIGIVQGG